MENNMPPKRISSLNHLNLVDPLRMNPPDHRSSSPALQLVAQMPDNPPFVVRLLPPPANGGLDGAFRVHLSPDALVSLDLKTGQLCHITGEHGESGYGLAWRATDKMGNNPKLRPAKMTVTLTTAFGFREGSQVTITKTSAQIVRADKVTLSDITPSDYDNSEDPRAWYWPCGNHLYTCEAIAIGATFDVTVGKGRKKRFCIDHIESSGCTGPALFSFKHDTQLLQAGDAPATAAAMPSGDAFPVLDVSQLGGLVDQAKELNKHLDVILSSVDTASRTPVRNSHVLLYGYEGTGKSLMIERLQKTTSCKVLNIERTSIPSGKIQSTIQATFSEAVDNQPSLILIDDLDELVSSESGLYAKFLAKEMSKAKGSRVLVVGACRSVAKLSGVMLKPDCFRSHIELPIPDVEARKQIINVLRDKRLDEIDHITTAISMKTHGFTGQDLAILIENAKDVADFRAREEQREWVSVGARASMLPGNGVPQVDGSVASTYSESTLVPDHSMPQSISDLESLEQAQGAPTLEDFEAASKTVKPTALREVFLEKPNIQWTDIGGSDSIQQRFDEILGGPVQNSGAMKLHNLEPPKGVLLYGPPGCSKTMTAQAVAATYDQNFIAVKGAELISMYVGESERAVREIFRKARQAAPCIIFFDEIDSIGAERDGSGSKGLNVLTTLLNEMDGFETMRGVLVMAATNKPEILDPALLRPGRFDAHVYVGLPEPAARADILKIALQGSPKQDIDFDKLKVATEGYSGAEIVGICKAAKYRAVRRAASTDDSEAVKLRFEDLEAAIQEQRKGVTTEMLEGYEAFKKA
jgi:AAA family ATPase